ncbi:DUF4197 domain-containing protein [Algoriphagus sp. C2-6-M1]|uniref:DUF4197 domain-containing protein n=1 Tax=Algoriphagus persicinus TaxID=3108754 RepID=UPI002B36CA43|nr:DUF4197 domain-containing protein [Algoriphagus sp. C2-6-M1]MEB2782712.1 DUF4197 domain-containing protein [Algoriphagus sp. C2-6-M1]
MKLVHTTFKKLSITFTLVSALFLGSCDTLSQLSKALDLGTPTDSEINSGLKQALEYGTSYASERLSQEDGYLGNLAIKIAFPEEAQKVENTLRSLGLGSLCDQVITSVNRAAEDAAIEAKPIFVAAIKDMSFTDVKNILLGADDAATQYFENKTTNSLEGKFKPIIESSLTKVGATKYWTDVIGRYNKIPLMTPIETDLAKYVTQKAIDGLFYEIAKEELKIRENAAARSTILLQKVFGYAEKQGT